MSPETDLFGWDRLRHGGLLLDPPRLRRIADHAAGQPLSWYLEKELRRQVGQVQDGTLKPGDFVVFVLQEICGFTSGVGTWHRGSSVSADWARPTVTGEAVKPRHLWRGDLDAILLVFVDTESRLGIGRGTKAASQTLQWLRAGSERLAVLTNGRQWRLVFAGLDFDAWCQWDIDLWFEEGALAPQVTALRTLLQPTLWTPEKKDTTPALLQAILDSRKGQAELSAVLGERVREAVELLVQAHGEVLDRGCAGVDRADIYRAAVRVVMRMVVVLFAESREKLLPRDNAIYHGAYGLTGLREELDKVAARSGSRLKRSHGAWPRVLALFRLVFDGSHHPDLPVPEYGGELFAPGDAASNDGLTRALAVLETACFEHELLFPDSDVHRMLELLTRTKVRIRQGRSSTWASVPVDFSDLSSEYIGILYEGLLDFELKTAPSGDPIIFLAVGNQPALPLSRLEGMDDKAVANLLEKMKDTSGGADDAEDEARVEATAADESDVAGEELEDDDEDVAPDDVVASVDNNASGGDDRFITRTRAEEWARRAVVVGKLLSKPRGTLTTQRRQAWEDAIGRKARQIVTRVVLPGEWYLVRWGGTRKGSGTFYTRPGLAVPTVHRTLRPLAFTAPAGPDGEPNLDAPAVAWTPRKPEEILALRVCDPACGSGTFPVAALRFLTESLYASLHHHGRISETGDRAIVRLLDREAAKDAREELLHDEMLPCRPSDETFEPRLKAVLRRHVVERCIYGVDLDPLAVELCRLSLWIETMDRDLPFSFLDHKIKCGNSLVGAWFDTFQHYPVMAWKNREGGDKGHSNGVHFEKDARTKVIKAFVKDTLTPDLQTFLRGQTLFDEDLQARASQAHAGMLATLSRLHELPVHAATDRGRVYREEVVGSPKYRSLKAAMDLWCACWFWPVTEIAHAPRPTTLAVPPEGTRAVAERVAARKRFLHWELEFPDVFNAARAGFDAILGNPPWEVAKPNSKEFFSNIDPLYRSYGKQEALEYQGHYFAAEKTEVGWLDYSGDFRAQSNLVSYAAFAFGDPALVQKSEDKFNIARGHAGATTHAKWRAARAKTFGFADSAHAFRHQGGADLNLYKLFVEQAHSLLRVGGRLGFIVPSGLYSDHGTSDLRRLFLDRCRWEWLFNFINWEAIFPSIYYRFKFNAIVVQKGGRTDIIRTGFVKTRLEDWENAEAVATPYSRAQVERFSPRSRAILEIQSPRDLDILEKIYSNSVLLGDDSPSGRGITYATEFHMTNDSAMFPTRPKWEADGYRPDEYSRWLKGDWRPIAELWSELRIDHSRIVLIDPECESRVAAPDVQRTEWTLRCAEPPYDRLPIPRADIPPGIILSREADAWIREEKIEDIALPLYEGRMIGQFDFSKKAWLRGKGRGAEWPEVGWQRKVVGPQFLMSSGLYHAEVAEHPRLKVTIMDVTSSTNARTVIATALGDRPCGHKTPVMLPHPVSDEGVLAVVATLNSFAFDYAIRSRLGGTSLIWAVLAESAMPRSAQLWRSALAVRAARLALCDSSFAPVWLGNPAWHSGLQWRAHWSVTPLSRSSAQAELDALVATLFGLSFPEFHHVLIQCDEPIDAEGERLPNGFWRVDQKREPELRHTVHALLALADLQKQGLSRASEPVEYRIDETWTLPETLRLTDYGLGHDERAKVPQPVASLLGPRFYDWQLAQTAEESWRECEIHARNLAGDVERGAEVKEATVNRRRPPESAPDSAPSSGSSKSRKAATQPSFFRVDSDE